jgi:hypothetical protein
MNNSFGGKFEAVKSLFKKKDQILEERILEERNWATEPIKTIQDLEGFYTEFGDKEWAEDDDSSRTVDYSRNYENLLADDEQGDDTYWEGAPGEILTPIERDRKAAELVEAENDLEDFENLDLSFTPNNRNRYQEDNSPEPVLENENPHTPKSKLKAKDVERDANITKRMRAWKENPETIPNPDGSKVVAEAEVKEEVEKQEVRVKPEVKIDLEEKKPKELSPVARFKLMQDVLTYKKLILNSPDLDKLRPKRGDDQLSVEQVRAEMKAYRDKEGKVEITKEEKDFFEQCRSWVWAVQKIEGYKGGEPKNPDGTLMSAEQMTAMQKEYYDMQRNNPQEFAKMQLAVLGERNVESGRWFKDTFTWKKSNFTKNGDQWICDKRDGAMQIRYITSVNPNEVTPEGKPAQFFYTKGREIPNKEDKNKKVVFVTIMIPRVEESRSKVHA